MQKEFIARIPSVLRIADERESGWARAGNCRATVNVLPTRCPGSEVLKSPLVGFRRELELQIEIAGLLVCCEKRYRYLAAASQQSKGAPVNKQQRALLPFIVAMPPEV